MSHHALLAYRWLSSQRHTVTSSPPLVWNLHLDTPRHVNSRTLAHIYTHAKVSTSKNPTPPLQKKRQTQDPNSETHKSVRCSWTLWQIYLGQIVSEKLPLELPWTKLAVGESKSRCMRVGDNGGRMCWCAAGGWGRTMDGLVSPLADWFEMAPLSLSPWGVLLSRFWFPLLTNSKQKSISFSRGGKISTRVSAGESDSKTYLQEMADSLTPLPLFMSFFSPLPSSSSFAVFIAQWWCWMVGCWMILFFRLEWGWGTCWRLRGSFAAGVINIKIYRDAITGWSEIGLMSPLGSLSGWTSAFSHSWRAFFSFFLSSLSLFSLPEKTR